MNKCKTSDSSSDLEAMLLWEQDMDYPGKLTKLCCLSDSLNCILNNNAIDTDEESPSIFEDESAHKEPGREKEKFLNFGR